MQAELRELESDLGTVLAHAQRPRRRRTDGAKCPEALRSCLLTLLEATHGLVAVWNVKGRLLYMNATGRSMLGIDQRAYLVGRDLSDFFAPSAYDQLHAVAIPASLRLGFWQGETTLIGAAGEVIPVSQVVIANRVKYGEREVTVLSSMAWDMREQKEIELRLRHEATHDGLTGLPNRTLLMDRLRQAIGWAARHRQFVAVVFIDLDDFKGINDTHGHEMANLLLRELSQRLRSFVRTEDTIARYGGDEFVLVVPELRAPQDLARVSKHVYDAFGEPFLVGDRRVRLRASIGVAMFPNDGGDADTLLRAADSMMYERKSRKNEIVNIDGTAGLLDEVATVAQPERTRGTSGPSAVVNVASQI